MITTSILWEEYADDLQKFIFSKIKDEQITNDLLQDVFLKVHKNIPQLKDATKVKSWIFTIARNTVFDFYKTKGGKEVLPDAIADEESVDSKSSHTEKDCLPGIIKALPEKYRTFLFLSDIEGVKQVDIAKQYNLPLATVKSRIQRARKMIVQGYMDCCDYKLNAQGKLVGEIKERKDCKICNH